MVCYLQCAEVQMQAVNSDVTGVIVQRWRAAKFNFSSNTAKYIPRISVMAPPGSIKSARSLSPSTSGNLSTTKISQFCADHRTSHRLGQRLYKRRFSISGCGPFLPDTVIVDLIEAAPRRTPSFPIPSFYAVLLSLD